MNSLQPVVEIEAKVSSGMLKNSFTSRLLKKVQMQGGARCGVRDVLTRTSQRRASAPTRQMGLFQQPARHTPPRGQ